MRLNQIILYLKIGDLATFGEFYESTKNEDLNNYIILTIEKKRMSVKLSDYIFHLLMSWE